METQTSRTSTALSLSKIQSMDFAWETGFDVNQDPPDDTAENHPDKQAYYRGFPRDQRFTQSSPIHSPPSLATNLMATFLKSNTANIDFPLRRNWRTRLTRTMSLLSRCWHTTGQQWCASIIQEGVKEYPKPKGVKFTYGTAGVRTKGAILESVCYRIALISALRSKKLGGKTVGLMVTASHNPEEDYGLKAVDSRGERRLTLFQVMLSTMEVILTMEGTRRMLET